VKPSPFTYHRPSTVEESLGVLGRLGDDAKVLAGGQSLVPMLSMRLAAPAHLVDINAIAGLAEVTCDGPGVRVGATARHTAVEHDPAVFAAVPLLRQALENVAHPTIRNRGTTVGSLVHADPAAELPAVLALLDGSVEVADEAGRRWVPAADFFVGPMESAVRPGQLATAAMFPRMPPLTGSAWVELSRRHGDYAMCGVGALVRLDSDLAFRSARVALICVGPTPLVLDVTPAGPAQRFGEMDWQLAADRVRERAEPDDDIHASAQYRRHLAGVLTVRALTSAARHASRRRDEP
jgi:aerobic carbon-monoxide dehydrogenase medium subunit